MADYDTTEVAETLSSSLRILTAGEGLFAKLGTEWRTEDATSPLIESLKANLPDLLVIDGALIEPELAEALAGPLLRNMPLVIVTGPEDSDRAGLVLDRPLAFVDRPATRSALLVAVATCAGMIQQGAADAGALYNQDQRIASLKQDAERVAAAIAEMVAGHQPAGVQPITAARIRNHIKARRLRDRFFDPELFADPVWDMLLDLSAARLEGRRVSVSSLCIAAHVPTTTALRTIKGLVDRGLLERHSDPSDARRSFIALSAGSQNAMEACMDAMLNMPGL